MVKATGMADCRRETEHGGCRCTESRARQEASRELTDIYVDGDACPVREEIYRVATRLQLNVLVVSNGSRPIRPPGTSNVVIVARSHHGTETLPICSVQAAGIGNG